MDKGNGVFQIVVGKNDQGDHIFSVVVKRTFRIEHGNVATRCATDEELRKTDAYYDNGDPEWSTVQYENELAPHKPSVDIVVIGKAYAPGGEPTDRMTASVRVGESAKSVTLFGDRECKFRENLPPLFTEPEPFTEMEIRYDRAYGGKDQTSDPNIPFFYPRNFMGKGVALRNKKDTIDGMTLPNVEDPADLLMPDRVVLGEPEAWPQQPLPQGFGWFQRTWYPRCVFAGMYPAFLDIDIVTPEERAGLVPKNHLALAKQFRLPSYHPRLNNGASHGMSFPEVRGGEAISLSGFSLRGALEFTLPRETPVITLDLGSGARGLAAVLDTVSIRPDDRVLDLIWRGTCVYEGYSWLPHMKRLDAEVQ